MKQKFAIQRNPDTQTLTIREYAELDKDILSLLCEETYEQPAVEAAIDKGKDVLESLLRTDNLYPPGIYAAQIVATVIDLYRSNSTEIVELNFNDLDLMLEEEVIEEVELVEEKTDDIDDLLEDDVDDNFDDDLEIKKIKKSSLKIADEDAAEPDADA